MSLCRLAIHTQNLVDQAQALNDDLTVLVRRVAKGYPR